MYKKFTSSSLRQNRFDPLRAWEKGPENCGYGLRYFSINIFEKTLEIYNSNRLIKEKSIFLHEILRIITKEYDTLKKSKCSLIQFSDRVIDHGGE